MIDFEGFWQNASSFGEVDPPRRLVFISLLLLVSGAATLNVLWSAAGVPTWPLLYGVLGVAVLLQIPSLLLSPRAFLIPMANVVTVAAGLGLLAFIFPFDATTASHWVTLSTGVAVLSAPMLGRIWNALFFSREVILDVRQRGETLGAAFAGELDALVLEVNEHLGGWASATIRSAKGERPARVTLQTLRSFAGGDWGSEVEVVGRSFLVHEPVVEARGDDSGETSIVGAAHVELIGSDGIATDPTPFRAELRAAILALMIAHGAITAASVLATMLIGAF